MIVIGGTYDEFCFEPRWQYRFGSGLRGVLTMKGIDPSSKINYHTFGDKDVNVYLKQFEDTGIVSHITEIPKGVRFHYDFPLSIPHIFPRLDILSERKKKINVEGERILYYGMVEGNAVVNGKRVVYDPQSPSNPTPFSATGSTAEELAVVINLSEAKKMAGGSGQDLNAIKKFFFEKENASVLILKMGAKGAMVINPDGTETHIPVYETKNVWPIGSGDVFAASFAYYWLDGKDATFAASQASWNTAMYCNSKELKFKGIGTDPEITPLTMEDFPTGQIYLAGPFFTFTERWLVDQIRNALLGMNLKVFSPWHDVGHGEASEVVHMDLKGLDESKLVFAILDGLDSGTLFEIGYAIANKLPVIGYVENETSENTKMLEGTNCVLEKDLTTAIYKSLWMLAKK